MEKTTTIARTYRLPSPLYQDLTQFRKEQELPPSETIVVQTALREYIERKRKERRK